MKGKAPDKEHVGRGGVGNEEGKGGGRKAGKIDYTKGHEGGEEGEEPKRLRLKSGTTSSPPHMKKAHLSKFTINDCDLWVNFFADTPTPP